ncbi:unnamed protein product, partial [marine sediment metagenome]
YTIPMSATMAITADGEFVLNDSHQTVMSEVDFGESVPVVIDWRLSMPPTGEPGEYHTTFYLVVTHTGVSG